MKKMAFLLIFALLILNEVPLTKEKENNAVAQIQPGVQDFCLNISDPSNVCIVEGVQYEAPVGNDRPIAKYWGYLFWEFISGNSLQFFLNTSNLIKEPKIYDPDFPNDKSRVDWEISDRGDYISITPSGKHFAYVIEAYYDPDVVGDTGFIVVFQSQVVNFPLPRSNGEDAFYKVDYSNTIILPEGAGIISFAPTEDSRGPINFEKISSNRYGIHWEYRNRALDSKHDPLITEVTYSYDRIYLQFTELVYKNQIEQQQLQDEQQNLEFLRNAFRIISTLAIVASIISVIVAYLLVKKRFDPLKQKARELPRRQALDVEKEQKMKIEVRRMLLGGFILFLIVAPNMMSSTYAQPSIQENIKWYGQYEIFKDNTIRETVKLDLPIPQNTLKIWVNTSSVWDVSITDENGVPITNVKKLDDRFEIENPPLIIQYSFTYNFVPYDNAGMLVYIDRFWLEYFNPNAESGDSAFLRADIDYNVVLPSDAIIYSASPSDLVTLSIDPDGRKRVRFIDTNREIDAFHDAWETQVSYSFVNVIDAIENLDVQFMNRRVQNRNINDLIKQNQNQVLFFAILGIIAPLISFLIAYWTFRRRALKEIERLQQQQEEQIFVETDQINAFMQVNKIDPDEQARDAFLGYYWELLFKLKKRLKKDPLKVPYSVIEKELHKLEVDVAEVLNLIEEGRMVELNDDPIFFDQFQDYAQRVLEILKQL